MPSPQSQRSGPMEPERMEFNMATWLHVRARMEENMGNMNNLILAPFEEMENLSVIPPPKENESSCMGQDEVFEKFEAIHPLTEIDQSVSRKYVRRMFIFDFPDLKRMAEASTALRSGLALAIRHYPFLGGMLGADPDNMDRGLVQVRYSKDTSPDTFMDIVERILKIRHRKTSRDDWKAQCDLGMPVSHWGPRKVCFSPKRVPDGLWCPVMTLQGTYLSSGALVLCFAFQHSVVDGTSIHFFLEKFTECMRSGDDIVSGPVYQAVDPQLFVTPPTISTSFPGVLPELEYFDSAKHPDPAKRNSKELTTMIISFKAEVLNALKELITLWLSNPDWVSTQDCLSAVIWESIISARVEWSGLDRAAETLLAVAVNTRPSLGPAGQKHFGNMFVTALAKQSVEALVVPCESSMGGISTPVLGRAARKIRSALNQLRASKEATGLRMVMLSETKAPIEMSKAWARLVQPGTSGVKMGSLATFGADLDFGIPGTGKGGKPRWCRKPWMRDEGMVNILPRRGGTQGNADWEVLVCLRTDEMNAVAHHLCMNQWAFRYVDDFDAKPIT
ncbi:hypothetical protein GQ53DRAFT_838191 [Thozetella sp. PMI_491]|nr:hypothetical protein GQ53DRAFT_838191 [Thozetella sp. PMI_491]